MNPETEQTTEINENPLKLSALQHSTLQHPALSQQPALSKQPKLSQFSLGSKLTQSVSSAVLALLVAATSAGALNGCKKKKKPKDTHSKTAPNKEVVDRGVLPHVVVTDDPVNLIKPTDIEVSEAEYLKTCIKLAEGVFKLISKLKTAIEKDASKKDNLIISFVNDAYSLTYTFPEFKKYLDNSRAQTGDQFLILSKSLAPLLLKGGYYFDTQRFINSSGGTRPELTIGKVEKIQRISFRKGSNIEPVPLYIIGEPMLTTKKQLGAAVYSLDTDSAFVFRAHTRKKFRKKLEFLNEIGISMKSLNFEELHKEYVRDSGIHEATHAFLKSQFPNLTTRTIDYLLVKRLLLPLKGGKMAHIGDRHHPMQFHEMCAVGNEIFNSESDSPVSLISYLKANQLGHPFAGYAKVQRILPLLILKHSNDSEMKRLIEDNLMNNRPVKSRDIARLAFKLSKKQLKQVGKEMYELGLSYLTSAQNGGFRKVGVRFR